MTTPTCETCRFFDAEYRTCHHSPPAHGRFPFVRPHDWCGQHKPLTPPVTTNDTP